MSVFSSCSLGATQRARHVAVMMVAMRPKIIRKAHLLGLSLNKLAIAVNLAKMPKNRYMQSVLWMLYEVDFDGLLRYFC
jgi:hypothetical protein